MAHLHIYRCMLLLLSTVIVVRSQLSPDLSPITCANVRCGYGTVCVDRDSGPVCECPMICPKIYDPVCGSDDEVYPNLCQLQVVSCEKQTDITEVRCEGDNLCHNHRCPDGKVCQVVKGRRTKKRKAVCRKVADPCATVKCGYFAKCVVIANQPVCECDLMCPDIYEPVCGSDGEVYSNSCYLTLASCQKQMSITEVSCDEESPDIPLP